jgi:hypothetical protein
MNSWINNSYARLLIDNHISEDDPSFMLRFDPSAYVEMVKKSGVDAAMVYATCHNGNCYYPTRVGHMHANIKGRDIFGETVGLICSAGITPVAYYTTVYHNHSAKNNPAWRMQDAGGQQHQGRYWFSCVNNRDYVEFTKAQIAEVIAYPVEGIFVDMTFWPYVCACANCRAKFRAESGREIPRAVDWKDPLWVTFQRFRERSMAQFTEELAAAIHAQRDVTVTFQNSPIIMGWSLGQTERIADSCDYASGDFYGGKYQHILGAKILAAATKHQPFEYMTSRCIDLTDHTAMKSEEMLTCEAATTLANGGAYFFIDAINPDGTLAPTVYERLGRVSSRLAPFTAVLKKHRPTLMAETGLYFSMQAQIDPAKDGLALCDVGSTFAHLLNPSYEEMLGASIALTRAHIPFRVVRPGAELDGLGALILNNVMVMADEEVEALNKFVLGGGTLIVTGRSGLYRPEGSKRGGLESLSSVTLSGEMSQRFHYLYFSDADELISCNRAAPLAQAGEALVLAEIVEPLFDPDDNEHYASIHSNPPGRMSGSVGLSVRPYGLGRCVYLASPLLAVRHEAQQAFAVRLLREYAAPGRVLETNAPPAVELTVLQSTREEACLIGLVNWQHELPNVPVQNLEITLTQNQKPREVRTVSGKTLRWDYSPGVLKLALDCLETVEIIEIY